MADLTRRASGAPAREDAGARVLALNCGSSSLKYAWFEPGVAAPAARGQVDGLGAREAGLRQQDPRGGRSRALPGAGLDEALAAMLAALGPEGAGLLAPATPPGVVAHRVVHGGERFREPVRVDGAVLAAIESLAALAPLHNPRGAAGIRELMRCFPRAAQVAVFDTAFHATLPPRAFRYALPQALYERDRVRRFGFHGTSHAWVAARAAELLERPLASLRLVSCHLGHGASVCAVAGGRSVDTSMGMTPNEGLVMGTRSGDLDPGIVAWLARERGRDAAAIDALLNRESGLLGLSGRSGDVRELERAAATGDPRAALALEVYAYRLRKYLGAYAAALGGLDAILFTGGVGQGSAGVRAAALEGLGFLGVELDGARNRDAPFDAATRISRDDSRVAVLVIPTDEERQIAHEALRALGGAAPAAGREGA